mmetsp:Transcript_54954/g.108539  ORF Transcript_54954/g.108539 Transcript_54954/m.108539 type:complete len:97 (+) Transcript_54954:615-905(+)
MEAELAAEIEAKREEALKKGVVVVIAGITIAVNLAQIATGEMTGEMIERIVDGMTDTEMIDTEMIAPETIEEIAVRYLEGIEIAGVIVITTVGAAI